MSRTIVIVGAGQAALSAAEALRSGGFDGVIEMFGDEPWGPYHRPPLSKAWLAGEIEAAQLQMRAPAMLEKKGIQLHTERRVTRIDRSAQQVVLDDGRSVAYDGLVLATGATPRQLRLPGADAQGVHVLRGRADAEAIAAGLQACAAAQQRVAIVGGGFIGLEVAATARKKGLEVTVIEAMPRLLERVMPATLSDWYAQLHRDHGVDVVLGAQLQAFAVDADGAVRALVLAEREIPVGMVVVGIGVAANDALAREAGLDCEHGIVVDEASRTSDPRVVAAGDCTVRRLANGQLQRLESVQNANEQGKSAAAALLGTPRPFTASPWFWSDQYDKRLQIAGLSKGADHWAVRGDMAAGDSFSVFHFQGDRLIAADSINASKDHLMVRKLLDAGKSPTHDQVTDLGFNLADLLKD